VHIPKTAGTTVEFMMVMNHGHENILFLQPEVRTSHDFIPRKKLTEIAFEYFDQTGKFKMIASHVFYGIHRFMGIKQPSYFTFLRHPLKLLISSIHQQRHVHNYYADIFAESMTLTEKLEKALELPTNRNIMTSFVSGAHETENISLPLLGMAIDNLYASEFVGITEEFEKSILLMARKLNWKYIIPISQNVTPSKLPSIEEIPEEKLRKINDILSYDRMLYDIGKKIFHVSIAPYGSLLEEASLQLKEIMRTHAQKYPEFNKYSRNFWYKQTSLPENYIFAMEEENNSIPDNSPLDRWRKYGK
jgi:hypothetical protein